MQFYYPLNVQWLNDKCLEFKLGKHTEVISVVTLDLIDIHDSGGSMLSLARLLAGT